MTPWTRFSRPTCLATVLNSSQSISPELFASKCKIQDSQCQQENTFYNTFYELIPLLYWEYHPIIIINNLSCLRPNARTVCAGLLWQWGPPLAPRGHARLHMSVAPRDPCVSEFVSRYVCVYMSRNAQQENTFYGSRNAQQVRCSSRPLCE